jgi:hypothetical protein
MRHDLIRLRHMLDAAQEAITFASGKTRKDLDIDRSLYLFQPLPISIDWIECKKTPHIRI